MSESNHYSNASLVTLTLLSLKLIRAFTSASAMIVVACGGLMAATLLDSGASGRSSIYVWGSCVVLLGKTVDCKSTLILKPRCING